MSESRHAAPVRRSTFPIAYARFSEPLRNVDFKGKGELQVDEAGERFQFTGRSRGTFRGELETLELAAVEISNALRVERRISFKTSKGKSGQKNHPFLFFCEDEEDARQIMEALPESSSPEFLKDTVSWEQLETVCPPLAPAFSPTNAIIAINIALFVVMAAFFGAGWFDIANIEPYIRFGANRGGFTTSGQWYRLLTNFFLHYGILHVALNMWALYGAGHLLERLLGRLHFLLIYLGTGVFASLTSIIWYNDSVWKAGASGAVFGVYGTLLACVFRADGALPASIFSPLRRSAVSFLVYNLLYGITQPGIDNAAHAGGVVAGFILGLTNAVPIRTSDRPKRLRRAVPLTALTAAALVAIGVFLAPTFDYDPAEELALMEFHEAFAERERVLVEGLTPLLEQAEEDDIARHAALSALSLQIIPHYQHWAERFGSENYRAGSRTQRNCVRLERYAKTRTMAFASLSQALRRPDTAAKFRYVELIEEANSHLRDFE